MFDPALPANGSSLVSAEMRSQFTGLKDLIDAISSITAAQIDSVTTGNPGDPASVGLSVIANTLLFTFALPRGNDGSPGAAGEVSSGQLNSAISSAISGTSNVSNAVTTLDTAFADPDSEALRAKMNELINALRR